MLFRPSPYELGRYNYALWAAPPDILVHRALRDRLEASGLVDLIPEGALREIRPGEALIVDGRIDRFEEVDIPNGAEGRVALALTVRTAGGADALLRRTYDRARPMALQSPEALARALSEALDEALGAFLGDLRQALAKRK
jgi:phytoene dehydrogenase-like protein